MYKIALITGASKRIGKQIAKTLHKKYNIIIHYNTSKNAAIALANELNHLRKNSASIIAGDLSTENAINNIVKNVKNIDLLVNNASSFYPTAIENINSADFHKILNINVLAPLLLSTKLADKLTCIVNIVDIHSQRPLKNYPIYNISKSGMTMLTKTLAKELSPKIRVNGVSPGSILWPENDAILDKNNQQKMLDKIPLAKQGTPEDIAKTVLFLAESNYITGQIISVDGGRTLNQ